jgi:hypothetical protein
MSMKSGMKFVFAVAVLALIVVPVQAAGYGHTSWFYSDASHTTEVGVFHTPEAQCPNDGFWSTGVRSDFRYIEFYDNCEEPAVNEWHCQEKIDGVWVDVECP